jgi:hypothetical protein
VGGVGRLVGRWEGWLRLGFFRKVGGRRRRECGRVEWLSLGSSDVERAHNLSNGVALGSGEAEELSQT